MKSKTNKGLKIISLNRKAKFNYFFYEVLEAGIVLKGSEVKSLRDGKANISESYAFDDNGEIYLVNSHIFIPEVSDFFIFPACLNHGVNHYQSNGERISVSGNLRIKV